MRSGRDRQGGARRSAGFLFLAGAGASLALLATAAGCQAILGLEEGKPRPEGEGGAGTTTTTTTTGGGEGGGGGGSGGSDGSGGTGGTGGSGAGGGATCADGEQNGGEIGVDCGGPACDACPPLLLLGGGPTAGSLLAAALDPATGQWSTSPLAGTTATPPSLAMTSATEAVGLACESLMPPGNPPRCQLRSVTWTAQQGWAELTDVPLANVALQSAHALTPAGAGARAVFHNEFYKYEIGIFDGDAWTAAAEPVGGQGASQNYGPVGADVAALGADAAVVFLNGNQSNHLQVRRYVGGAWLAIEDIAANTNFNVAPRMVALQGATPQLLVVYVQSGTSQIGYRVWANSGWLIGATNLGTTPARPALAALPDGRAILAYQGTNNRLYYAFHAPMGWSVPAEVPSVTEQLLAPPAVAAGAAGAVVDLAYVTTGGLVRHVRYENDTWSAPVDIGTFPGITHLTLASAPLQP